MAKQYVNVYEMTMQYGGCEEGGWWWDLCVPISSSGFSSQRKKRQKMWKKYIREVAKVKQMNKDLRYGYTSVLGGVQYFVCIEDHPGKVSPEERPYYC